MCLGEGGPPVVSLLKLTCENFFYSSSNVSQQPLLLFKLRYGLILLLTRSYGKSNVSAQFLASHHFSSSSGRCDLHFRLQGGHERSRWVFHKQLRHRGRRYWQQATKRKMYQSSDLRPSSSGMMYLGGRAWLADVLCNHASACQRRLLELTCMSSRSIA